MITFEELKSVHVELSSACNAACPNCPRNIHGGYPLPGLDPSTMSLVQFQSIFTVEVLNQLERFLFCGNYGDPIYCRDLPDILAYVASVNPKIRVKVHTNGGIRSPEWWHKLAESYPVDRLLVVFSVDGLADTNHVYRRNVVWDRLQENINSFISAGGNAVWEFLIFQHNEHQIESARAQAEQQGFADIVFKRPFGFESVSEGREHMKVVDRRGDFEYFIYPASAEYQHQLQETDVVSNDDDLDYPPAAYHKLMTEIDRQHYLSSEKSRHTQFDSVEIDCMTKDNSEIYIDSRGRVHPCCFLGVGTQDNLLSAEHIQYQEWLNRTVTVDEIDATQRPLREILEQGYLQQIEANWQQSHSGDRLMCCTKMCASKKSLRGGLYV